MLHKILLTFTACCGMIASLQAQEKCTIHGTLSDDKLRYSDKAIEKVYLNRLDLFDNIITVDSALIENKQFTINYELKDYKGPEIYLITGFDNGNFPFFVEPGNIEIQVNTQYPVSSTAKGTQCNDLYTEYKLYAEQCLSMQVDSLKVLGKEHGNEWLESKAGFDARTRIGGEAKFRAQVNRLRFLMNHNDTPLAPLMLQKELIYTLEYDAAMQALKSLSPSLEDHNYYQNFSNAVLAKKIDVGSTLPNINMPTADGKVLTLKDFRGKYVLLDFWASWCGPCRREIPYVIKLYNETRNLKDKFVIISFSLDNNRKNWEDAIPAMKINLPDWVHVSDLYGWNSPAARMLGISAIPKTFLIDPEGKVIAFDLRGDHMIQKVKELLNQ